MTDQRYAKKSEVLRISTDSVDQEPSGGAGLNCTFNPQISIDSMEEHAASTDAVIDIFDDDRKKKPPPPGIATPKTLIPLLKIMRMRTCTWTNGRME